jgi:hypothetical protein
MLDPLAADARLVEHREVTESGCWNWTRSRTPDGYGRISWRGHGERVHRVAAHLAFGFELAGEGSVLHHCDNPACFNPGHLYVGSQKDNVRDMVERGRGYQGPEKWSVCKNGHALEGDNLVIHSGRQRCRICLNDERKRRYQTHNADRSTSGEKGVHYSPHASKPWRVGVYHGRKMHYGGRFASVVEAVIARDELIRALEGATE